MKNKKEEMASLLDRADTYLESAKLLFNAGDYESSVSRSYYAMFFAAEAILLTKERSASTHKGIISVFGDEFIKTGILPKDLGKEFTKAFEKRQLGDYKPEKLITKDEAKETLEKTIEFIDTIISFLGEEDFELSDEAKKALREARETPEDEYVDLDED